MDSSTVLAATRSGLFRSTDGGASWSTLFAGRFADLEVASNGDIYSSQGIFSTGVLRKSTDNGLNWSDVTPAANGQRIEIAIAPGNDSVVYAVASNNRLIEWLYRSNDGGQTWTQGTIPFYLEQSCVEGTQDFARDQAWYDLILAVDPNNDSAVVVGGISHHKSTDGGTTWTPISYWTGNCEQYVHADQHAIATNPNDPDAAVMGSDGGVSYTTDLWSAAKPTFNDRNNGYNVTQFFSADARNDSADSYILTGAQDNGSLQLNSAGIGGGFMATGGDGAFSHVDQDTNAYHYTAFVFTTYYQSVNNGASFTNLIFNQSFGRFINPTDYDDETKRMYAAGNGGQYVYSNELDQSNGWFLATVAFNGGQVSAVKVSPYTSDRVFFGTGTGDLFMVDSAYLGSSATVTEIGSPSFPAGYLSSVALGTSDDEILVTFTNYGVNSVWETKDGGATWTSKEGNLPDMPIRWALYNPNNTNEVLLATELGVWSTDDLSAGSVVWEATNSGLANVRTDMLQYRASDGQVTVATHGRGAYTGFPFSGSVSAPVNTDSLVLDLPLDTCNTDFVYNLAGGNNGTTSGATYTSGYVGQGLVFDGVDDYVNLGANPAMVFDSSFSVASWVNTTNAARQLVIGRNADSANVGSWNVFLNGGNVEVILGGLSNAGPFTSNGTVNDGNWHHVAVTKDGGVLNIYIDGVLDRTFGGLVGTINANPNAEVWLGHQANKPGERFFAGQMDIVKAYNYAIDTGMITSLAAVASNPGTCAANSNTLVGYWQLDDCGTTALTNQVGGPDGSLVGTAFLDSGYVNQGGHFGAFGSYAALADTGWALGAGNAFSYSLWMNANTANNNRSIVLGREEAGSRALTLRLDGSDLEVYVAGLVRAGFSNPQWHSFPTPMVAGTWAHIGITFQNSVLSLYVDGVLVSTIDKLGGTPTFTTAGQDILGAKSDGSRPFNGIIDEVRIFNEALTGGAMASEFSRVSYSPSDCPEVLAGGYSFDSCQSAVALDNAGLNDGVINGATRATGYQQAGMSFDGVNDNVNLGTSSVFELGDEFTIATWINTSQTGRFKTILAKNRTGSSFSYQVLLDNGRSTMTMGGANNAGPFTTTSTINDGTWHHIAWTFENGILTGFVDGVAEASFIIMGSLNANAGTELWIGNRNDKTGRAFAGTLDEFYIYETAMKPGQVAELANATQNSSDCSAPINVFETIPSFEADLEEGTDPDFNVYPNPSAGVFVVEWSKFAADKPVRISVSNALGQTVFEQYEAVPAQRQEITLNNPTPGIYLVTLSSEGERQVYRMVIE
ncbi:MAG: LamG-like jellyroll fold domain-containing protein [Bacteroidota bacterium]